MYQTQHDKDRTPYGKELKKDKDIDAARGSSRATGAPLDVGDRSVGKAN